MRATESVSMTRGVGAPVAFEDADRLADAIIARVGKNIELALPLGLGKANHVANALFARAAADPTIKLRIFTALTLEKPRGKGDLERRFLEPIADRVFAGYPELAYARALHARTLPPNVKVDEFFFAAGTRLGIAAARADRSRRLCRRPARGAHGGRRRHLAARHRIARRCGGAGAHPAASAQRGLSRSRGAARSRRARARGSARKRAVRARPLRRQRDVRR